MKERWIGAYTYSFLFSLVLQLPRVYRRPHFYNDLYIRIAKQELNFSLFKVQLEILLLTATVLIFQTHIFLMTTTAGLPK